MNTPSMRIHWTAWSAWVTIPGIKHARAVMRVVQNRNHVITQRRKDAKMTENETSGQQHSKVHTKQVFTYLKLKGLKLGFVLNFGANLMKEGIERVVNGLSEENLCVFAPWRETKLSSQPGGLDIAGGPPPGI